MPQLNIPKKLENNILVFVNSLKEIYGEDLISVNLYGSAASGEFVNKDSNLNILVVLKSADLESLKKSCKVLNRFKRLTPIFLSQEYIASSTDIFPIEFLDMQENYTLFYGRDVLKEISVDTRNLRFQCEQELKAKLINLKQTFLNLNQDKTALRNCLLKSFNSLLHVLRNVLRVNGIKPPYLKQEVLKELSSEFKINLPGWEKILAAKMNQARLSNKETDSLFINFVGDLEKIVEIVDRL